MVNEWTSNDMPSVSSLGLYGRRPDLDLDGKRFGAAAALEAVVEHLNANHPKSDTDRLERQAATIGELQGCFLRVEADAARWRRAHTIVEAERDQARASLHEACKVAQSYKVDAYQATERAEAAERELDEWKARAEAAEARTAPAVTRAGVKNAIDTCFALAPKINTQVISDAVCDFLGVEAEPADPLLDKAQEFAALADWELTDREAELLHTVAAHVLGQEDRHVD